MAEYERSRHVDAAPDEVFAFVSDPANMAAFVPTMEEADAEDGRVHVHGEVHDRPYDDDGWFRVDVSRRRLEWGSDERDYSGWLSVAGDNGGTQVVAHISAAPFVDPSGRPISDDEAPGARRYGYLRSPKILSRNKNKLMKSRYRASAPMIAWRESAASPWAAAVSPIFWIFCAS